MSTTNSVLYSYLLNLNACQDALDFVATQSSDTSVDNNVRGNYFIWLARTTNSFTDDQILRMKIECLDNVLELSEVYQTAFQAAQVYLASPTEFNLNSMRSANRALLSTFVENSEDPDNFTKFGTLVATNLSDYDATSEGYASRNDLNCAESIKTLYSSNFKNFLNSNTLVTQNLVRHLDAGIPFSLVSQNSTQWIDLVNNEGHNIIDGSYNSENRGSIVFNGSSTYIDISIPVSSSSNYTKEAWVRLSTSDGSKNIISSESDVFWINNGTLYGGLDSQYFIVSSSSFPVNTWKHVVLTFNDSTNTMTLYVDGVQVDQNTQVVGSYQGQTLRIGAHFSEGSPISFWEGRISSVRVYSKELSSSEVSRNYNSSYLRYQTNIIPTTTLPPSPEGESPTPSETPTNTPTVTSSITPTITPSPTPGLDSDAQAFILAASPLTPTEESAIITLVASLKSSGIWSGLKVFYPFVGTTAQQHKLNLINPSDTNAAFRLTFYGGWLHTSSGLVGNGSDTWAETHFEPAQHTLENSPSLLMGVHAFSQIPNTNPSSPFTDIQPFVGTLPWSDNIYSNYSIELYRQNGVAKFSSNIPMSVVGAQQGDYTSNCVIQNTYFYSGRTTGTNTNSFSITNCSSYNTISYGQRSFSAPVAGNKIILGKSSLNGQNNFVNGQYSCFFIGANGQSFLSSLSQMDTICKTFASTLGRTDITITPSVTPTNTVTPSITPTNTETPTNTPSNTVTPTETPTNTPSNTVTPTETPTNTPTNTETPTNTPTNTETPTNTPTNTETPTNTPTNTETPTETPPNTPTNTETPTNTPTNTETPTNTPSNTTSGAAADISTSGLLLYINMSKSASYPGTGITVNDLSPNGYNGTLQSGAGTITYNSGSTKSLSFAGGNLSNPPMITWSTGASLVRSTGAITVCAFVRATAFTTASGSFRWSAILTIDAFCYVGAPYAGYRKFNIGFHNNSTGSLDGTLLFADFMSSAGVNAGHNHIPGTNMFNQDIYVVASSQAGVDGYKMWVNGVLVATKAGVTTNENPNGLAGLHTARLQPCFGGWFIGNMYSIHIYNRVLSNEEVLNNYNILKTQFNIP